MKISSDKGAQNLIIAVMNQTAKDIEETHKYDKKYLRLIPKEISSSVNFFGKVSLGINIIDYYNRCFSLSLKGNQKLAHQTIEKINLLNRVNKMFNYEEKFSNPTVQETVH